MAIPSFSIVNVLVTLVPVTKPKSVSSAADVVSTDVFELTGTYAFTSGDYTNTGTMKGTGTFIGNYPQEANATFAPGLSPGTYFITGDYTETDGVLDIEVDGVCLLYTSPSPRDS